MLRFEPYSGTLDDFGAVLETYPDREVFQTPAWLRFIAEAQGATPVIAVLQDGNSTVGHFAGHTVRKAGLRILGSPFIGWTTEQMGIRLADGVPRRAAAEALLRFAFRELGCVHVEFSDASFAAADFAELGFAAEAYSTQVVDLRPPETEIYQRMSSTSCRYRLRKAAKAGVVVEEACDPTFADNYYAQLRDVFAKNNLVPSYSVDRVHLLMKHLLPTGNLLLLRSRAADGRCIATGIFPAMNQTAYFWGNASWRQDQHLCPNEPLHWYAIRYWKQRGIQFYDLCGGGDYKRKYGGTALEYYHLYKSKYRWIAGARNAAYRAFRLKQRILGWWKQPAAGTEE